MVPERFIERGTDYLLEQGKLSVYETNCACKDIKFYFDQHVFTLMLSGHKTIESDNLKFEFFPGTFFIPEKERINLISIPNASLYNPTKCLVLELNPSFIKSVYDEILYTESRKGILYDSDEEEEVLSYFLSNDQLLIRAFTRLYEIQSEDRSVCKPLAEELLIKEMLYRIFCTEGLQLIKDNFEKSIGDDSIRKVISYINHNIDQKLSTQFLASMAGMGQTTFFKVFKRSTGQTPVEYMLGERIRQAKILIRKGKLNLQEIAYRCGFNSYEYFCLSFKKIEKMKPTEFKKQKQALRIS